MNTNRPEDSEVAELPEALSGELLILQAAYRAAEQRDAEPSPAIDDALRAAARRAVHAGPEVPLTRSFFHFPTFATPLAAAAVIVLAVSVGFLSMNEPFMQRHLQPEPPMQVSVVQAERPVEAAAPAVGAQVEAKAQAQAEAKAADTDMKAKVRDASAAAATAARDDPKAERAAAPLAAAKIAAPSANTAGPKDSGAAGALASAPSAPSAASASSPSPAPASVALAEAPPKKDSVAKEERARAASAPSAAEPARTPAEPVPVMASKARESAPVMAAAPTPPPAPPAAAPAPVAARAAPAPVSPAPPNTEIVLADSNDPRLKGLAKRERYEAPVTNASPPAAASPSVATGEARDRSTKTAQAGSSVASQPAAYGAARTPPQAMEGPGPAQLRFDESNPKAWLENIVKLKERGLNDFVKVQVQRFRERYPDHPLPESLQERK